MTVSQILSEGFMPITCAAKYLGYSKSRMYELVASGTISHIKSSARRGSRISVSRAALEQYAKERLQLGAVA